MHPLESSRDFKTQGPGIFLVSRNATKASISAGVRFPAYAGMFTAPLAIRKII